jgi:hypothetical protein
MFFNTVLTPDNKPVFTDTPEKIQDFVRQYHEQLLLGGYQIYIGETNKIVSMQDFVYKT